MELLAKVLLATIVVVAVIGIISYALQNVFTPAVTKVQAESLVLSDMQNANPGAAINITNATQSTFVGSWHIVVAVVANATSPCPSYSIVSFDYPKYGFVYRLENTYTSGCNIYEASNGNSYIISSYPVAITKSYLLNITSVTAFVGRYGFHNVTVTAQSYNSTTIGGTQYHAVWVVRYAAPKANHAVYVILAQSSGSALAAYNASS